MVKKIIVGYWTMKENIMSKSTRKISVMFSSGLFMSIFVPSGVGKWFCLYYNRDDHQCYWQHLRQLIASLTLIVHVLVIKQLNENNFTDRRRLSVDCPLILCRENWVITQAPRSSFLSNCSLQITWHTFKAVLLREKRVYFYYKSRVLF